MAEPHPPDPALLVVAAFSRHDAALLWASERLQAAYGPLALTSALFDFHQTAYYEATMGPQLRKQFFAFQTLITPELLPNIKLSTNALENELAASGQFAEPRPLNLDPGLILLGKFVLATTKDQQHRLYLRDGIFAEVTLRYQDKAFEPWPWTYADYRTPHVHAFLQQARDYYRQRLQSQSAE
jgi:Domain of unknown function (DUF4416)